MQPWQFTANVKVNSESETPNMLWPETLRRTDSEIRVLRRAWRTVIMLGAVPRSANALPQGRCLEISTALGLSEPTRAGLLRKSYTPFRDSSRVRPSAIRTVPASSRNSCLSPN